MADLVFPDFAGKVLVVMLTGRGGEYCNVLRNVRLETQAGRVFLVGEILENPQQPAAYEGLTNAVAWDQVSEYVEFDSAEEFHKRLGAKSRRGWFG